MTKPVILTGLRANNDLHIGNYFGALLPLIDMAKSHSGEYQINLFVPDLHSFTTPIDHSQLQAQIMHNLRLFVAAGLPLDNPDIHIYRQSFVPAHSELTWILDCFTGFGEMSRMTQFKDKSRLRLSSEEAVKEAYRLGFKEGYEKEVGEAANTLDKLEREEMYRQKAEDELARMIREGEFPEFGGEEVSVGLFNYPVLMAADILLYGAQYVPVGDDQTQHLEFTRDIAERMNSKFGELFVVPEPVKKQHEFFGKDQGLRIKDLQDPSRKMSKSDETGKGIIFLGDNPDEAAKKIMSAATDSVGAVHYDPEKQPGITNLLQISALLANRPVADVAAEWKGKTSYGELKTHIAEQVRSFLTDFQQRLTAVDDAQLTAKLNAGEDAMRERAEKTLYKVQQAVGLRA